MKRINLLVAVAVGAVLVAVGMFAFRTDTATADDAYRTTSLGTSTFDFDGSGAVNTVTAIISTTNSADDRLEIQLFVRPSGGSESAHSIVEANRNGTSGTIYAHGVVEDSSLGSGDRVRAVFKAFTGSTENMSYERTYTKP